MKSLFTLILFVLGISISGFAVTPSYQEDGKDTISKMVCQDTSSIVILENGVQLDHSSYKYFVPIDINRIKYNYKTTTHSFKFISDPVEGFSKRYRKKWITCNVLKLKSTHT